jgi:release factor glutamine methyltransferase
VPPVEPEAVSYQPTLSEEHVEQIRVWHDRAYAEELEAGSVDRTFDYLGLSIVVPPQVMPITPMSHLLGERVLAEVAPGDRVLDMGTGSGVNAILAASRGADVLAVDNSAAAVGAARLNVARNDVSELVEVRHSDIFSAVAGSFDRIVFDPPFRWFKPRSLIESVMADEGYQALTRFFRGARSHLSPGGRMLLFFGTSGDLGYLERLMAKEAFSWEVAAHDDLVRDGCRVDYFTFLVS